MKHTHPDPLAATNLLNRREFLGSMGSGLGSIAFATLLAEETGLAQKGQPQKAKRVVQILCPGAASQIDLWEHKPELQKRHGQPMPGLTGVNSFQGGNGNLFASPWQWKQHGKSGKWLSELVPNLAESVDDIAFVHSLSARSNTHGPAMLQINTGFVVDGFPSMGAWLVYAMGSDTKDLPAFVAIPDVRGLPPNGPANWGAGFLPAAYQGTSFTSERPIANLASPPKSTAAQEKAVRGFLQQLNQEHEQRFPGNSELSARMAAYDLAARMQLSAPEVTDISREPRYIRDMYGADDTNGLKASYARNCILARRLLERGVRFVQLYCGACASAVDGLLNWDAHKSLKSDYERHCPILDQPSAALLKDLKQRGMLKDTLVLWTTEFGRMPTHQTGAMGRDHNPFGFTAWMAGAGVNAGTSYGATDEFGYKAAVNPTSIYDFHATVLKLLGIDHKRLTYYHNGSQRRLTDVHGEVIEAMIA